MRRIECSVWNNGGQGWGVRVLGGPGARKLHFCPEVSPVVVEVDGLQQQFNVRKMSFWTKSCGELIGTSLREWKDRHALRRGDRVHLSVLEKFSRFRLHP
jgi:hypothetical protein